MDARFRRERAATFDQRGAPQLLQFVQRRKFGLKILLQRALGICRDIALGKIKTQGRYARNDQHHRRGEPRPETRWPAFFFTPRPDHGKSRCTVAPLFSSTGFSSVVLLSIHALSV